MLRGECRQCFAVEEMWKQTTGYNVNSHLRAKFNSCRSKFDAVCTQPCLVTARPLLCYERLLSTRISNVVRVSLERARVDERRFQPSAAVVSGYRFRPNLRRLKFGIYTNNFCSFEFYATVGWIHVW